MMYYPQFNLEILGVFDRGMPNTERIHMRATDAVALSSFALLYGLVSTDGEITHITPFDDAFFWFGTGSLSSGEHLYVYTGIGETRRSTVQGTNIGAFVMHWGRSSTMFANSQYSVGLIHIGGVLIAKPPEDRIQIPRTLIPPPPPRNTAKK